jgi:methyl-accepting chemotaxis protein
MVAPGVAIAFLVLLGMTSYGVLTYQNSVLADLFNNRFANYQLSSNAAQDISEVHSTVYRLFTWLGNLKEDKIDQITAEQKSKIDAVNQSISKLAGRSNLDSEEIKLVNTVIEKIGKYKKDVDVAVDMSKADYNMGLSAMQTADGDFQVMIKDFVELIGIEQKLAKQSYDKANSAFGGAVMSMIAILVFAVAVSVGASIFMSRKIVRQIGGELDYASEVVRQVSGGDLTVMVETKAKDQSSLLYDLKNMSSNLASIVTDVRKTTDMITSASKEIAAGNSDLSQRTAEQASSLEETASSMEELASTVRQNAENARQANQLAVNASDVATKGGHAVNEVVQTMSAISDSSKKIVEIISVIEGIAFQTNILALNAAVEAARAGEQGRGFAVVAAEVRSLAQRSAAAAKEISSLINASVTNVDIGSMQADKAGATMNEIVTAVKRVTDIMSEIAAASNEQSAGIEQVNGAITQMDDVTQQNAALVEEAAASAEAMQEQANFLMEAVRKFKLDTDWTNPGGSTSHASKPANPRRDSKQVSVAAVRHDRQLAKANSARDDSADSDWKEF